MNKFLIYIVLFLICCSSELPLAPELTVDFNRLESATTPLDSIAKSNMNGIYSVLEGKEMFGDEVVGKWIERRWCLYAKHDVVFSENAGGSSGDLILLTGYVRIVRSGSASVLDLKIYPDEGSKDLLNTLTPSSLIVRGRASNGKEIVLKRVRNLNSSQLFIVAHRGGGRNSERLGVSENSLAMLKLAQYLGATGVEIDVKRTRDGKLIVFHDDTFSPRTVQGSYLLGDVGNFDLSQIKQFGRLIYGESIPTLEEALNTVIDSTILSLVWLDIKDPSTVDEVIRTQLKVYERAKKRNVLILLGIPSQDILNAYNSSSLANTTPILIEFNFNDVLSHKTCQVWGPRWTNGINSSSIVQVHDSGRLVFTWTLDYREYISDFLNSTNFDGILSNYPSLVAGMYYSR
ncbi:MAG: hypothetical protein HW421_1891 [Ignavibacteria bacterium]|nr:hypothetical protein [Ignavibacteria bacterium]